MKTVETIKIVEENPFGFKFHTDEEGRISLTDIWKEAGSPKNKSVADWFRLGSTEAFIATACRFLNMGKSHVIKKTQGKGGGTHAHIQIVLEYAQYLDPKLAVAINQVFIERAEEEKDPSLAIERAKNTWRRKGKSEKWINMRIMSLEERKSFTSTLKYHGVVGIGYKDCTNAIYKHLWGGGASIVRAKKQLPDGSNCRDHMTEIELAGVRLAELMAEENIEVNNVRGNAEAVFYCESASKNIAQAIMNNRSQKKFDNK